MKNLFSVEGKVVLITGGSRGIGEMIARGYVENGAKVYISSRKAEVCDRVAEELSEYGTCISLPFDLGGMDGIAGLANAVKERESRLDVLVNNAGATWGAKAEDYPDAAWHKVMNLNVSAPFFLTREVAKRVMIPKGQGNVIITASVAAFKGTPPGMHTVAYNTSKAAAVHLARTLASEWGPYGIRVNAICPGFFPSKLANGLIDQLGDQLIARAPLRRIGGEEDLKGAAVYLASDASRHMTGQALVLDGGASLI